MIGDTYRVNIEKNPRYDWPPMIPDMDRKSLQENTKEKDMRRQGRNLRMEEGITFEIKISVKFLQSSR